MHTTSSQRWAIGAIALAVLIACSPRTPEQPSPPQPTPPTLSDAPAITPAPASQAPGFADTWAVTEVDCGDPSKASRFSAARIEMPAEKRSCIVTSIDEQHPTGRSAIYMVATSCSVDGKPTRDEFRFEFGAADTVMQMQLNGGDPMRLVRCPRPVGP